MKKLFGVIAIELVALLLMAQTTTPPWSGTETQQLLASCTVHNTDSVICVATDGVAFSYQGAPFVKVSSPTSTSSVSFSQITGTATPAQIPPVNQLSGPINASQMPAKTSCQMSFTLGAPISGSTNTLSGIAQMGGCQ